MNEKFISPNGEQTPALIPITTLIRQLDISRVTLWRWRDRGWLSTVNVAGAQFVTAEELAKFKARAAAGEFAKQRGNFKRKGAASV